MFIYSISNLKLNKEYKNQITFYYSYLKSTVYLNQ